MIYIYILWLHISYFIIIANTITILIIIIAHCQ